MTLEIFEWKQSNEGQGCARLLQFFRTILKIQIQEADYHTEILSIAYILQCLFKSIYLCPLATAPPTMDADGYNHVSTLSKTFLFL